MFKNARRERKTEMVNSIEECEGDSESDIVDILKVWKREREREGEKRAFAVSPYWIPINYVTLYNST